VPPPTYRRLLAISAGTVTRATPRMRRTPARHTHMPTSPPVKASWPEPSIGASAVTTPGTPSPAAAPDWVLPGVPGESAMAAVGQTCWWWP
jgi:hypothetical protein